MSQKFPPVRKTSEGWAGEGLEKGKSTTRVINFNACRLINDNKLGCRGQGIRQGQ